ncbi:hypothetical protein HRG_004663 [Hirsutella rhossiliensis]|uniref:Uncharacterized protein n=1 Tax=Hirsutella rhossiliensis TaxID=111463 RepID=A0A9P8SJZ8_9HYPO|nr:uncharacterized protein HRG_04663 [Hirsutella rhossiliensis]KAH0964235.1 hypothetical protein HRG_04663 [Hirsutella rhossiliensis]
MGMGMGMEGGAQGRHWLLMLRSPEAATATWHHTVAAPWRSICNSLDYALDISADRPFDAPEVVERHRVAAGLDAAAAEELGTAVRSVEPRSCRGWAVEVLRKLQDRLLVLDVWVERRGHGWTGDGGLEEISAPNTPFPG